MVQKIIKVGNSLAVTIPISFIKETGFKHGDEVFVEQDSQHKMLLVKPKEKRQKTSLTPEFFEWLDKTVKEYEDVIKELAHR